MGESPYEILSRFRSGHDKTMDKDIQNLRGESWETDEELKFFAKQARKDDRLVSMAKGLLRTMNDQVHTHFGRYLLETNSLYAAVFDEQPIGLIVASILLDKDVPDHACDPFNSEIQGRIINPAEFQTWLTTTVEQEKLVAIRNDPLSKEFKEEIQAISEGLDIWNGDNEQCHQFREHYKLRLGAEPSTNHGDNERHVKKGSLMMMSTAGKSELMAKTYAIASNGFSEYVRIDNDNQAGDAATDDAANNDDLQRRHRGKRTLSLLEERVKKAKIREAANLANELGAEEYVGRKARMTNSLIAKEETRGEEARTPAG
jgi:hypothetical protein